VSTGVWPERIENFRFSRGGFRAILTGVERKKPASRSPAPPPPVAPAPTPAPMPPPPDRGPEVAVGAVEAGELLARLARRGDVRRGTPGAAGLSLDGAAVAALRRLERDSKAQPPDVAAALEDCQKQFILWDVTRDEHEVGEIEREPAVPLDDRPEWAAVVWIGPFPSAELAATALASGEARAAFAAYRTARSKAIREPYRRLEPGVETDDAMGFYLGLLEP